MLRRRLIDRPTCWIVALLVGRVTLVPYSVDLLLVTNIGGDRDCAVAEFFDKRVHPLLAAGGEYDADAFLHEQTCRRFADSA